MSWVRSVKAIAALTTLAGALCSCGAPTSAPATPGPATRPGPTSSVMVLDDGSLTITPASGTPKVPRAQAARVLAAQQLTVEQRQLVPILASVSASLPLTTAASASEPWRLHHLQLPLAWVYLAHQSAGLPLCSGVFPAPSTSVSSTAHPSRAWVVVIDASTSAGAAYTYVGAGAGFCQPSAQPTLRAARLSYSIPFTDTPIAPLQVRQSFQLPPCGSFDSFLAGPRFNLATASVPTGDCHQAASTRVDVTQGRITEHPHAALGIICWATVDAAIGAPADCVTPAE